MSMRKRRLTTLPDDEVGPPQRPRLASAVHERQNFSSSASQPSTVNRRGVSTQNLTPSRGLNGSGSPTPSAELNLDDVVEQQKRLFGPLVLNVFLPPRLPDKAIEKSTEKEVDHFLLTLLERAADEFGKTLRPEDLQWWKRVQKNLATSAALYKPDPEQPWLSQENLIEAFSGMESGDFITLYIRRQNAGVVIRKDEQEIIFESFEASPLAEAVADCRRRLKCSFPGPRIATKPVIFQHRRFIDSLAEYLAFMDGSAPDIPDGKGGAVNDVGSTNPSFITHLLTNIIRGVGYVEKTRVTKICKRVGDAVLGTETSVWRRSPFWLVVRVGLQSSLKLEGSQGMDWYKLFLLYFMSKLLQQALEKDLVSQDYLYIMGAKIGRRLQKLGGRIPPAIDTEVTATIERLSKKLERSWGQFCQFDAKRIKWDRENLDVVSDCKLRLPSSDEYLVSVMTRATSLTESELAQRPFVPGDYFRVNAPLSLKQSLLSGKMSKAPKKDLAVLLMDIESWVDKNIDDHVVRYQRRVDDPEFRQIQKNEVVQLGQLFDDYFRVAVEEYEGNPENLSVAFLTGFEIWVAMDKITTSCTPLLAKYHPEIKGSDLNNLILPSRRQMQRLSNIQTYIMDRATKAVIAKPTLFKDKFFEGSFPCLYFDQEPHLQDLLENVREAAAAARNEMRSNLKDTNTLFEKMMIEVHKMDHDLTPRGRHRSPHLCARCLQENVAKGLTVGVHEWPLPDNDEALTKTLIFELDCPEHFSAWRDTTFKMLINTSAILQFTETHPETRAQEKLSTYIGLRDFYKDRRSAGVMLASQRKAIGRMGGVRIELPAEEDAVMVPFSLRPRYWYSGTNGGHWVSDFFKLKGIWDKRMFSYTLPPKSVYKPLQFALRRSDHTSNEIIALQHKCPPKLSLHEFLEYGCLRAGHNIQWLNISKALKGRSLSLDKKEVSYLILQAAWEAGPAVRGVRDMFLRETHRVFAKTQFILDILDVIHEVLMSIKTNWREVITAATLISLTCRCLALIKKDQQAVITRAINLVLELREMTYSWIEDLRGKIRAEQEEEKLVEKLQHLMHCAAICRMTYEVPNEQADELIDGLVLGEDLEPRWDTKHLSIFLETAAIIRDNLPAKREHVEDYFRYAIDRSHRLSHRWENRVRNFVLRNPSTLDFAIEKQWQPHIRRGNWEAADRPNQHWLRMITRPVSGNKDVEISLNLLDGQILMDSIPFGRLPQDYITHPTYDRIFRDDVLVVGPSSMSGMQFETRFPIEGHSVHFALKGENLVIRSHKEDTIYELVPHTLFANDLCRPLVDEYTHWLDISTSKLQFRQLRNKWDTQNYDWVMALRGEAATLSLLQDPQTVVIDPASNTASQVNQVLNTLEESSRILITARRSEGGGDDIISAELRRLNLKFSSKDKNFVCRNFPGFMVDEDQNLGCFHGLASKLVLRKGNERIALVPFGEVSLRRFSDFTRVSVLDAESYQAYTVDKCLGRLVGNGSITSRLYQLYLHAVTSSPSCQVDTLTGRTGTEEAASLLFSGAVRSFQELENADIKLIHLVAHLTPHRSIGLSSRRGVTKHGSIENVVWNDDISFNCQRDIFRVGASQIIEYWMKVKKFLQSGQSSDGHVQNDEQDEQDAAIEAGKEDKRVEEGVKRGDNLPLRRAAYRNEIFYAFLGNTWGIERGERDNSEELNEIDLEANNGGAAPIEDASYTARDGTIEDEDDKGPQVCQLVKLLITWRTGMEAPNLWGILSSFVITGVKGSNNSVKLQMNDTLLKRSTGEIWCALFQLCRTASREEDIFKLIFTLGTLMYREGFDPRLVHGLAAAAILPEFRSDLFKIPKGHFDVKQGYRPATSILEGYIRNATKPFEISRYFSLRAQPHESQGAVNARRRTGYNENSGLQRAKLRVYYENIQWEANGANPVQPENHRVFDLINLDEVHELVTDYFRRIHHVARFKTVLDRIQNVYTDKLVENMLRQRIYTFETFREITPRDKDTTTVEELMYNIPAPVLDAVQGAPLPLTKARLSGSENVQVIQPNLRLAQLQSLSRNLMGPRNSPFQKAYADDLKQSVEALRAFNGNILSNDLPVSLDFIQEHATQWKTYVKTLEKAIRSQLEPIYFGSRIKTVEGQTTLYYAGLWPRVTNFSLLRLLSYHTQDIPDGWKRAIAAYGVALRELGRAERLVSLATRREIQGFWEALADMDERKWDPIEVPEWLLLELENNFCMRDVQAEIAKEMISPASGSSSVMQLNMGEGKSSVIIPAVAATLADGTKLVRVVVLKPLSREMFNLLRSKLGGLCSRRIYFLPFHRGLEIAIQDAQLIKSIYEECMSDGGILLVQNEHLLSFKLLGLEKICMEEDEPYIGPELHETQKWLDTNSRDLLDESDEILRVNHTLVYTVGTQQPMSNQPYRWLDLLKVFDVIKDQVAKLRPKYPQGFELDFKTNSSFPYLRILQPRVAEVLIGETVSELIFGTDPDRQWFTTVAEEKKTMILKFVTDKGFPESEISELKGVLRDGHMWAAALLFRGLFAYNIMQFCLQEKRWRVDYGADFSRTLLAVPFKAKDTPSSASDFAHPEVLLCLTCLSWYNYGLDEWEVKDCIEIARSSDNPDDLYRKWIRGSEGIPEHLQSLKGVNLDNPDEFTNIIYPLLRSNKWVIDFYLQSVIFPRYSKQFPYKLTSSGWDIVEKKTHLTSGFSGTNDNKYLLPLSIQQGDLKAHQHTNALVLNYLLLTENNHFMRAALPRTKQKMTVKELLDAVVAQNPPISVLLDVGAQVLEMGNEEVAGEWLARASKVDPERWQAAIFFNSKDEICVIDLAGRVELLMTSNFAKQMESCLCYLDDAHTRGTDLKFPIGSRALVTLGPKTTKDRLVQGAMRMRKLGKGHSVVFCAPPDVESQILSLSSGKTRVENVDVLKWALRETCKQTKKNAELWAAQGVNYAQRQATLNEYERRKRWQNLRRFLFEQEKMSLSDLYGPRPSPNDTYIERMSRLNIANHPIIARIIEHCKIFEIENFNELTGDLDEEQEREVEQEAERERQIEQPLPAKPYFHELHKDVVKFVTTGKIRKDSTAVEPAIVSLRRTSIRGLIRPGSWSTKLLVSADFSRTVYMSTHLEGGRQIDYEDDYIRPVSFILSSVRPGKDRVTLLIISPFEANQLLDRIKASQRVHLHIYMPRVTKSMSSFEDLKWMNIGKPYSRSWSVPSVLMDQLNLFAGQLYFRNSTAYYNTAEFLGLRTAELHPDSKPDEDGFVPPGHRRWKDGQEFVSPFKKSPIPCMQQLVAMRRKGIKSDLTQLGLLLHGKLLQNDQFDEIDSDIEGIFGDEPVTADESDTADYIKEEVEPLQRSAAATLRAQRLQYAPLDFNEEGSNEDMQQRGGDVGDGEEEEESDGMPPIKSELDDESDDDFDRSLFYRESSPIVRDEENGPNTVDLIISPNDEDIEMQW